MTDVFDIESWKVTFGYTAEWFELKFIDDAFVREQAVRFEQGADRDVSHYKWAAYRHVLASTDFSDRARWREFVRVIEADPDEHLFRGALAELLDSARVPPEWLTEYEGSGARFIDIPSVRRRLRRT